MMSLAYPGVYEAAAEADTLGDTGGKLRLPMSDLFRQSIEYMRIFETPAIESITIDIASKGSESVIVRVFCLKKLPDEYNDMDVSKITIPKDLCCQICAVLPSILTFATIGGSFCSQSCATVHWRKETRSL
jgi:hypothetical protein